MKRLLVLVVALTVLATVSATAATWYSMGTLSTDPNTGAYRQDFFDGGKPEVSGITVDASRNLAYIATNVNRDSGKITVINATTGAIVGEVTTSNAASQIVIGGDGAAYAVCNQRHSTSNDFEPSSRIIRIDNWSGSWSQTKIWAPEDFNAGWASWPIIGITVDAYGNVAWGMAGNKTATGVPASKYYTGWKYALDTQTVSQTTSGNTGFSQGLGYFDNYTSVGKNAAGAPVFAVAASNGGAVDLITGDGTLNRVSLGNAAAAGLFAGNSASVYDPVRNNFFFGGVGAGGSTVIGAIDGTDGASVLNNGGSNIRHAAPDLNWNVVPTGIWVSDMALDPSNGSVLYSLASSTTGAYATSPYRGHVLRTDVTLGSIIDEGLVDPSGGQVVSIANYNGNWLAVTLDTAGHYRLYSTVPEPSSILALCTGLVGMAGFAIRRKRA